MSSFGNLNITLYCLTLGTCDVSPSSGVALSTNFTFTCAGWTDPESPLTYEFSYGNNQSETLFYYRTIASGESISLTDWLPAGEQSSNYTQIVTVKVKDSYGSGSNAEQFMIQVSEHFYIMYIQISGKQLIVNTARPHITTKQIC